MLTDFYHRFPTGQLKRIPLCPLHCIDALATAFVVLRETLERIDASQSYGSLWADSPKFRHQVLEILRLNGLENWGLPLGDMVALAIGSGDRAPLLGQYNFLLESLSPVPKEGQSADIEPPPPHKLPPKKMSDVFPIFDTDGGLVYPRGVMASLHSEFGATYMRLSSELQEIESAWVLEHPAIALLWSDEVRALSLHLIELFGLDPKRLNIHQVCELAIAYRDEPGLLPQLAGLTDTEKEGDRDTPPIPKTPSTLHFLTGVLTHAGVKNWESLLQNLTFSELESFQQGYCWAADGGESERKKQNKAHRHDVFNRRILQGQSDGVLENLQKRPRKHGRGIGL